MAEGLDIERVLSSEVEQETNHSKGRGGPMAMKGSGTTKPQPVRETVQVQRQVQEHRAKEGGAGREGAQGAKEGAQGAKGGGYHLWPDWGPC